MTSWAWPALAAFFCWGLWAFLPKLTVQYLGPRSAILYEVTGAMLAAAVLLTLWMGLRAEFHPRGIVLALCTGVLGMLGALAYLYAVQKGPVALVATVTALYPVLTVLMAVLFLGENVTLRQGLGVVLAFIAIVLVSR